MKKVITTINRKNQTYPIIIGSNIIGKISSQFNFKDYTKIVVLTDKIIAKHYLSKLRQGAKRQLSVIYLPSGEQAKTIKQAEIIWKKMIKLCCDRRSLIINLGGGAVGDVGGFVASAYMRGMDFINIPTTLLAQVDAAVGGKTGVNLLGLKNIIGTFDQPKLVLCDVSASKTMPSRQFVAGFAEVIKHGIIYDRKYFDFVTRKKPLQYNQKELVKIVEGSCRIKTSIIKQDETEMHGARKMLNFGHTAGHAIESILLKSSKPMLHGEALSVGMMVEAIISAEVGLLDQDAVKMLYDALKFYGLPTGIRKLSWQTIFKTILHDKKTVGGTVKWTLLVGAGKAVVDINVKTDVVKAAFGEVFDDI